MTNETEQKANRKFIEDVIELHEMGKDIEQIMFSLNMVYEEEDKEEIREEEFDYTHR